MPAKSEKQYRAMQAAAHGRSKLGIPASVGREFTKEKPPRRLLKKGQRRREKLAQKFYTGAALKQLHRML